MKGEKRAIVRQNQGVDLQEKSKKPETETGTPEYHPSPSAPFSDEAPFLQRYAISFIVFLISLFFILAITNPGLYTNDEWITANQLHQLDIGHQVTFSEGKYGVTKEGTVSAYFTSRENLLMYSLALPVSALPVVKLFGFFGDNFRLIIILIWSLCIVLTALLLDTCYPAYARIQGLRLLFPALLLALFLFLGNILLYKQFPFAAADAPFEVAALVLVNSLFFALVVSITFEICRIVLKNIRMALFGTFAIIACSSYIFWAGTAKDHILTTLVLAGVMYFFVKYLSSSRQRDAGFSFIFSGLLIWVRPEVGFFITIFTGAFYCIPLIRKVAQKESGAPLFLKSLIPLAGVFLGGIPFFLNNYLISHNFLIPVLDLKRDIERAGTASTVPLPSGEVVFNPAVINQTGGLDLTGSVMRAGDAVLHQILPGLTLENAQGFTGVLFFPTNGSIGFLIMCPLLVIGLVALILWNERILPQNEIKRSYFFFFMVIAIAVFFSYFSRFSSMNVSNGILPDMRYLSPAYLPCGLFSMLILSRLRFFKNPGKSLKDSLLLAILVFPVLFGLIVFIHPFGDVSTGYMTFAKFIILTEVVLCSAVMILARVLEDKNRFFLSALPWLVILTIVTTFTFQVMLASFYGMLMKMNGYPFWLPVVREGVGLFIVIQYLPPV
jgi:hypothetical protein